MLRIIALIGLSVVPASAMAEAAMVPGKSYEARMPMTDPARVVFHPDGRVLLWEADADKPRVEGHWSRRNGQFCIQEGTEYGPLCLAETAGPSGGFNLSDQGVVMDFVPLPD